MSQPPSELDSKQPTRNAGWLVGIYAAFTALWFGVSDSIVIRLFPDPAQFARIDTFKDALSVAFTSVLLYVVLRRQFQKVFEVSKSLQTTLALAQRNEVALRDSEYKYRALFENSQDAVMLTTLDGVVVSANAKACELLGYNETTVQQLTLGDLVDLTDPRVATALEERRRNGKFAGELAFFRSNRRKFPAEVLSQVFDGPNGQKMTCTVVRDLTEQKKARAMLELKAMLAEALLNLPAAAQSMSEHAFMQFGLELAEKLTGSQISFIHLVGEDQETVELVAWSQATRANFCTAAYDSHYPLNQAGLWADALRMRAPVVVNDYASATVKPEGHAHLERLISIPVLEGGLVRMIAGVGNKAEHYTDTDVETLRLISDAIWSVVHRRRAEKALRESEQQLQVLTNNVSDVIWTTDLQGYFTYVSPSIEALSGFKAAEILHKNLSEVVAKKNIAAVKRAIEKNIADEAAGLPFASFSHEFEQPCKDGSRVWTEVSTSGLYDEQGTLTGMVGVTRNIAKRKKQDKQLQLATRVFEQGQEGVTVTDAAGAIVMVNPTFTRITGYEAEEVIGKNPRILHSGRQDDAYYRTMWEVLATVGQWSGEIWNKKKDGSVYPEWLSISALRDENDIVTHYVANFSDLSQTKAAESRIQWLSHFDPLTGLPNRTLLQDRTSLTLNMMQRSGEPLTMMLVAVDHFGTINDTLGHHLADQLLVEMARRLSQSVRKQDTVARLGGKEFMMILPGTDHLGAAHFAKELLEKLSRPCMLGEHELSVTASIGIVSYPDNGHDFESLLKAVEIAMHRAQDKGRNNYEFYSVELYEHVLARDAMAKALRQAISQHQLNLVYQPQVDLQTGKICGLEALLRWSHPVLGHVSPNKFIPMAEEAGLIIPIGEWVLKRACQDIRHWTELGINVPHVAINASPLQFRDNDFTRQVRHALTEFNVDPARIYIEVTEGALMDDVPRNEAILRSLKELGVKLSLDDFGTGYSSLSYLKRFPFDQVKIDQSFVRDIATNPSDMMLVKVIISMAHGMGMKTIAEGVETEAQCEIMRTNICDEIQGFYFSKPVTVPEIEAIFSEARQLPEHLLRLKSPKRTLLLVDDEPNIVSALKRLFRRDGHEILTANSGAEGLQILAKHSVDIIISDQRMPGMTGVEFLRAAKVLYPDTIRIVLSGYTELQSVTDAINEGSVYRFLTKPWDDEALREQIDKAIQHRQMFEDNRQLEMQVHNTNRELMAANRRLQDVLKQLQQDNAKVKP